MKIDHNEDRQLTDDNVIVKFILKFYVIRQI